MSLTSRLQALLTYANNKTGKNDPNLGEAVRSLVDGYGSGGGDSKLSGTNLTLIDRYEEEWDLSSTSFVIGETAPTSDTRIMESVANKYTKDYNYGENDVIVVQKVYTTPIHAPTAIKKGLHVKTLQETIGFFSGARKTPNDPNSFTRRALYVSAPTIFYYNSSGNLSSGTSTSYGFYTTPVNPSFISATNSSTTLKINSPICGVRASNTYETAANMKLVTECNFKWTVEMYIADKHSNLMSKYIEDANDFLDED